MRNRLVLFTRLRSTGLEATAVTVLVNTPRALARTRTRTEAAWPGARFAVVQVMRPLAFVVQFASVSVMLMRPIPGALLVNVIPLAEDGPTFVTATVNAVRLSSVTGSGQITCETLRSAAGKTVV